LKSGYVPATLNPIVVVVLTERVTVRASYDMTMTENLENWLSTRIGSEGPPQALRYHRMKARICRRCQHMGEVSMHAKGHLEHHSSMQYMGG
jgi:hypothetical protein